MTDRNTPWMDEERSARLPDSRLTSSFSDCWAERTVSTEVDIQFRLSLNDLVWISRKAYSKAFPGISKQSIQRGNRRSEHVDLDLLYTGTETSVIWWQTDAVWAHSHGHRNSAVPIHLSRVNRTLLCPEPLQSHLSRSICYLSNEKSTSH